MTTIEETPDIEATSGFGPATEKVDELSASKEISDSKEVTEKAVSTEESISAEEVTSPGKVSGEDFAGETRSTEMEELTADKNDAMVVTAPGTPASPSLRTTLPVLSSIKLPCVTVCSTSQAVSSSVDKGSLQNAPKRVELQPVVLQDPVEGLSAPPSTPAFTPLSVNNSFQNFSQLSELLRFGAPEPFTPTFAPLSVNNSFQSDSKSFELLRVETPKVSNTPCTPTFPPFSTKSSFLNAFESSGLHQVEASEPTTPTLASISKFFQSASKSELQKGELSIAPSTPTFAHLSVHNSFKGSSSFEFERVGTSELPTTVCTPTFTTFSVKNILQSVSKTESSPILRVSSPPSTPTLLTPVIGVPTAKLLSSAE